MSSKSQGTTDSQQPGQVLAYLGTKAITKEGMLKYNYYHKSFGYVGMSHLYSGGDLQYYIHLELKGSEAGGAGNSFLEASEGITIRGHYLEELRKAMKNTPTKVKAFNQYKDCRTFAEKEVSKGRLKGGEKAG